VKFKMDLSTLYATPNNLDELSEINFPFPRNTDVYFRAKQKEIVDQYFAARMFMNETETHDWKHKFKEAENKMTKNKACEFKVTSYFYESALIFYNIVIDLSWVLCYSAAEYAYFQRGKRVNFSGVMSIDEATRSLRIAENNVTNPTAKNNPFGYIKMTNPDFLPAIDLITDFCKQLDSTEIRSRYNYCKHKGKPAYFEFHDERLNDICLTELSSGKEIQVASNIIDVQIQYSLKEGIESLFTFDNEVLFPYIRDLINELERVLQPSPMV